MQAIGGRAWTKCMRVQDMEQLHAHDFTNPSWHFNTLVYITGTVSHD